MNIPDQPSALKPLKLGFSPCPNDTFIFEALVNKRIDTHGLLFNIIIQDVEELNKLAFNGIPDVTKVSFGAYLHLVKDYVLLNAGAALGRGCGPLLIAREPVKGNLADMVVAIPGESTTANLLLGFAYPEIQHKKVVLFSEIEDAVIHQQADLGLIIHESRFTYANKGLIKIADLGEVWEKRTFSPIPLGGIIAKRSLGMNKLIEISDLIKNSLQFAYAHTTVGKAYIKSLAQETEDAVIQQHIDLYVNNFSLELGAEGKKSVETLFRYAVKAGLIREIPESIFLEE